MALFRGIQEYIALDANNITLVFDSGNIVNISGNIFLYPPQGHPILYKCLYFHQPWRRREPNNWRDQDCLALVGVQRSTWGDKDCQSQYNYICQFGESRSDCVKPSVYLKINHLISTRHILVTMQFIV